MPNKNSRKNEKQTAIAPKISEHNFMLNEIRKKRKKGRKTRCHGIYGAGNKKAMCGTMRTKVHGTQKRKGKKGDTQRLFESFFSLVLSLFSVCIFIRIS